MPARCSEGPRIDPASETGEGTREHWDEAARRAARSASWERSLPDRDHPRGAHYTSDGYPAAPPFDGLRGRGLIRSR